MIFISSASLRRLFDCCRSGRFKPRSRRPRPPIPPLPTRLVRSKLSIGGVGGVLGPCPCWDDDDGPAASEEGCTCSWASIILIRFPMELWPDIFPRFSSSTSSVPILSGSPLPDRSALSSSRFAPAEGWNSAPKSAHPVREESVVNRIYPTTFCFLLRLLTQQKQPEPTADEFLRFLLLSAVCQTHPPLLTVCGSGEGPLSQQTPTSLTTGRGHHRRTRSGGSLLLVSSSLH